VEFHSRLQELQSSNLYELDIYAQQITNLGTLVARPGVFSEWHYTRRCPGSLWQICHQPFPWSRYRRHQLSVHRMQHSAENSRVGSSILSLATILHLRFSSTLRVACDPRMAVDLARNGLESNCRHGSTVLSLATIRHRSVLVTWFSVYSGDMVNSFTGL